MSDQRKIPSYGGKMPSGDVSKTTPDGRRAKTDARSGGKKDTAPQLEAFAQFEQIPASAETAVVGTVKKVDKKTVKYVKERTNANPVKYRVPIDWADVRETCAKTFLVILPVLAFLAGQILLYVRYFSQNKVLLFDFVSNNVSVYALLISSVFALITTILTAYGGWKYADDGEYCRAWMYAVISGILLGVMPQVTGFIGIFSASVMTYSIRNEKEEIVPAVAVFTAFALGQIIMWFIYAGNGYAVAVSEIWELINVKISLLVPLIASTVCGAIASVLVSLACYGAVEDFKGWKAFGYTLPLCLAIIFLPSLLCLVALIYALIVRAVEDSGSVKLLPIAYLVIAMATMGIIFSQDVPQYVPIIVSAGEIGLFLLLFNGNSKLSDYGEEYPVFIIVVLTLAAAAVLVLQIVFMEDMFPKLAQIRELIADGKASQEFYDKELGELRATMIMGYIVLAIAMVIGVCVGDRNIPSVVSPLAIAGGSPSFVMILNALIEMPEGAGSVYEPSFFLWTVIGSVLVAIPCAVYMVIVFLIGERVAD